MAGAGRPFSILTKIGLFPEWLQWSCIRFLRVVRFSFTPLVFPTA